jgi:hypothetical protein
MSTDIALEGALSELIGVSATHDTSGAFQSAGTFVGFVAIFMLLLGVFGMPASACEADSGEALGEHDPQLQTVSSAQEATMVQPAGEYPPLIEAILSNDAPNVRRALSAGADPNAAFQLVTPLGWALDGSRCAPDVVRALADAGADLQAPIWPTGQPPLHLALSGAKRPCVDVLLESGANVLVRDKADATTIHAAALAGMLDMVELFARRGVNVTAITDRGWSALMAAALAGSEPIVRKLLELGADPCTRDSEGLSAGDIARRRGLLDLAKQLDEACAQMGARVD